MLEMLVGMTVSYIAFTEQGHRFGNWVAQTALTEGKKLAAKQKPTTERKEGKKDEA